MTEYFLNITQRIKSAKDSVRDHITDLREGNAWIYTALIALGVYLFVGLILAVYWSSEPDTFSIHEAALAEVEGDKSKLVTGVYTTSALVHVVETMLEKPGGYISNDIIFPGIWMDNIPHWEYGVLMQVRDLSKAMRESFSRSQSQSVENEFLAKADPQFNFSHDSWMLPKTESEYREGVKFVRMYLDSLADSGASATQFYSRADNLSRWLSAVEMRLGSLSQSLSASVGPRRLNTDLAGDPSATQATQSPGEMKVKTPWTEIDDVFFRARGSTWALIHFLKAVEKDFASVLEKKNATVSLQQIIRELEATQHTVWSPMILNGDGFGMLANHSLVMASYISSANAAVIDLRELLTKG